MYGDSECGNSFLEEYEALCFNLKFAENVESHGMDMPHETERGTTVIKRRNHMEEYGMVSKFESFEYDCGPRQSYEMETQMEVA